MKQVLRHKFADNRRLYARRYARHYPWYGEVGVWEEWYDDGHWRSMGGGSSAPASAWAALLAKMREAGWLEEKT